MRSNKRRACSSPSSHSIETTCAPISAVVAAAQDGDLKRINALWEQDPAKFRLAADRHGSNALHFAAGCGHVELCEYLVRTCGIPATHRNGRGRTALHWAARNGKVEVCQLLVGKLMVDPNCAASGGVTPLQLAVWQCHEHCARWLAGKGADVRVVNDFGCTTAHWCAMSGTANTTGDATTGDGADDTEAQAQKVQRMCTWLRSDYGVDFAAPNKQGHTVSVVILVQQVSLVHTHTDYCLPTFYTWIPTTRGSIRQHSLVTGQPASG
jgi:hypothetical protein